MRAPPLEVGTSASPLLGFGSTFVGALRVGVAEAGIKVLADASAVEKNGQKAAAWEGRVASAANAPIVRLTMRN